VQINPDTAQALGIENGHEVLLHGPGSIVEGWAWVSRTVPRWMVCSSRSIGESKVAVYRKGQTLQEALSILKELVQ
jgi:hypothetical protein